MKLPLNIISGLENSFPICDNADKVSAIIQSDNAIISFTDHPFLKFGGDTRVLFMLETVIDKLSIQVAYSHGIYNYFSPMNSIKIFSRYPRLCIDHTLLSKSK